jgi:hypothetical protein
LGRVHTPETKKKISEALTGRPNTLLGRKLVLNKLSIQALQKPRQNRYSKKKIQKKVDDLAEPGLFSDR